jgi:hypothetical protein
MVLRSKTTIVAVLALALAGLALGLVAGHHGSKASRAPTRAKTFVAGDRSFSVSYPSGWQASAVGATGAVLQRSDHRGVVLVRERPALKDPLSRLVKDLPRQLAKRFSDFHPVGASVARLATGPAVVYTFVRTKANMVQTIVIAPTARRSFTLEAVAPAGARDAARQAGQIVRSLKSR